VPYRTPSNPRAPRRLPLLERIAVKTSCSASWDEMVGDDVVRFCCTCSKSVYDLTAMNADDAELFLAQHVAAGEPLPCARLYRRADGRVLTSECAAGASRRHLQRFAATAAVGAACAVLLAGMADLAMRPVLGPDDEPEAVVRDTVVRMQMGGLAFASEPHQDEPGFYDVDRALRSDESTRPEDLEPEGEGPARRRYVRDDPDKGIIRGTVSLVRDVTDVSVRQRRRRLHGSVPGRQRRTCCASKRQAFQCRFNVV
jgi:hypothetical protein